MHAHEVTVIGATGRLAIPVVRRWAAQGIAIRAMVRDLGKARRVLPDEVRLVQGDLRDVESLRRGLEGTQALYLNLSTDTLDSTRPFYAEHQGVANVLDAAREGSVAHILQLSGLGAHPAHQGLSFSFFPNEVRRRGQELIRASGIPFTFFHATWFLDTFERFVRNGAFSMLGTHPSPIYFTNTSDLADQVRRAIGNRDAIGRDFAMQGPEALSLEEAAARYLAVVSPTMPIRRVPLWVARASSVLVPDLRMPVAMTRYLQRIPGTLLAEETWDVLGRPSVTLEQFFGAGEPRTAA